jgi:hypothetical protein
MELVGLLVCVMWVELFLFFAPHGMIKGITKKTE